MCEIPARIIPYYWSSNGTAEVEFVVETNDEIIPIEVKADNCVSGKSLTVYAKTFSPKHRVRMSGLNLQYNSGFLSLPAPLGCWLSKYINEYHIT